ncbi:MAG TPA: glycosyltransferase [Pyrinomonadaceae bacterium]|jgi:glycosyltransferase involved in cell wall biosynthesis|nr:glycosyltransferase [Pyrinomonadaceae bacterium]
MRVIPDVKNLLIVSSAVHYRHGGRLFAYGAYAREIDVWADLFPHVRVAAPCRDEQPPGDCLPFTRANIEVVPQLETGGDDFRAKAVQVLLLPLLVLGLCRAMRRADAIHVRCPGNLGLLSIFLAPMFSRRRVAKYAGQWNGYAGEPWAARLQRKLLRSRLWRAPVTVYGRWANQPPQVVPFFTSILTDEQVARARDAARRRRFGPAPPRVLFVGRLYEGKNVDVLLAALGALKAQGIELTCDIVGEGPLRTPLERQVALLGLQDQVEFAGGVEFERVLAFYERADVLVLASENEGWPKAVAEGMAFGLVCVGSDTGFVPEMLKDGRGVVVPPGDVAALARALRRVAASPEERARMSARAAAWAQRYSLEGLREALRELFAAHWKVSLDASPRPQVSDAPSRPGASPDALPRAAEPASARQAQPLRAERGTPIL